MAHRLISGSCANQPQVSIRHRIQAELLAGRSPQTLIDEYLGYYNLLSRSLAASNLASNLSSPRSGIHRDIQQAINKDAFTAYRVRGKIKAQLAKYKVRSSRDIIASNYRVLYDPNVPDTEKQAIWSQQYDLCNFPSEDKMVVNLRKNAQVWIPILLYFNKYLDLLKQYSISVVAAKYAYNSGDYEPISLVTDNPDGLVKLITHGYFQMVDNLGRFVPIEGIIPKLPKLKLEVIMPLIDWLNQYSYSFIGEYITKTGLYYLFLIAGATDLAVEYDQYVPEDRKLTYPQEGWQYANLQHLSEFLHKNQDILDGSEELNVTVNSRLGLLVDIYQHCGQIALEDAMIYLREFFEVYIDGNKLITEAIRQGCQELTELVRSGRWLITTTLNRSELVNLAVVNQVPDIALGLLNNHEQKR